MHLKKLSYRVLLSFFLLFILFKYLLFFKDNTNIQKNSIEHYLVMPSAVTELPVEQWGKVMHFHHNNEDGTTSQMDGVILAVKQEPDKILKAINNYFIKKQFCLIKKKAERIELKKDKQSVSIYYHYNEETDFFEFDIMFY